MFHLIRTEWLKIKNYPGFWWIMGVTLLSYPGINGLFYFIYNERTKDQSQGAKIIKMLVGNPFEFPEVFRTVAYSSSLFVFIPAILIIMLITNEYTYKTNRQNVIDGWSRNEFLIAKFFNVVIISLLVVALYLAVTLVIGFMNTPTTNAESWKLFNYTGLFALQVFSQLSFAFLLGLLIRRAFIALGVFIFYKIIFENIAMGILTKYSKDLGRFLPTEVSDRLTPVPSFLGRLDKDGYAKTLAMINEHVLLSVLYLIVFWVLVFWIYKKRDL
ncbi:MAG: ABC transporter permease [Chitinophagaceae bacterium]|nr:ABC transporter permease [Chitinophagaceae bacterium]